MTDKKLISKSSYLIYRQCPKYFWYYINDRKNIPEFDQRAKFNFKIGHIIGNLAKLQYREGVEASSEGSLEDNIEKTKALLESGKPVFEAGFMADAGSKIKQAPVRIYARADILLPVDGGRQWDIIEVKSSAGVKAVNITDVAFQKYCYREAGLNIRNCFVMHINSNYILNGGIDPFGIFRMTEITEEADKIIPHIKNDIRQMAEIMEKNEPPVTEVGKFCGSPFDCPLKTVCWENIRETSIFYLNSLNKKTAKRIIERGFRHMHEIPEDFPGINYKQKIQIDCAKNSECWVDKTAISNFISNIEYPLYFLDFETFSSPVPLIEGTRPYQAIPFQFSLHIAESPDSIPEHHAFLADGKGDPRPELSIALRKKFGFSSGDDGRAFKGSLVVYNESAERAILRDLAAFNSRNGGWIFKISSRIIDLYDPFKNFYFYNVSQKGSASIKKVLPALTDKNYSEMAIKNGDIAGINFLSSSMLWKNFITLNNLDNLNGRHSIEEEMQNQAEKEELLRFSLEQYCKLDTEGLYHILEKLKKLAI